MNTSRHRHGSPHDLFALVDKELSLASRLGRVALVLVLLVTSGTIGLLGVTEPSLPVPARIAFAAIIAFGVSGSVLALRALSGRRALLAWHRVIGCRMAVAFAAIVVLGASIIGYVTGARAAFVVAGFGVILLCGTIALLRQAQREFAALTARRHALAQQLKVGG